MVTMTASLAAPTTTPSAVPLTDTRPRIWPLMLGGFLATYLFSIGNIALPDLQRTLVVPPGPLSLVMGLFAAAFAGTLLIGGRLGDRYGRRRLFVIGMTGVLLTAVVAALAPTIEVLLAARLMQGAAAAALMPQILATVQTILAGRARAAAIGTFSATSGVGTVAGQLVGGAVISLAPDGWGWRAAFLTAAVVAAVGVIGAFGVPPTASSRPAGLDPVGSLLTAITMVLLVAGLSLGPSMGWSGPIMLALLGAAISGVILVLHQRGRERRGAAALLPPSIVGLPAIRLGMLMALLFFAGYGAFSYNFSLLTQRGLGTTAMESGLATGLFAAAFVAGSLIASRLVARLGSRVMQLGALLQILGLAGLAAISWLGLTPWTWWFQLVGPIMGVGQALMYAPLVATVMAEVPDRVAGMTGGLISTAQQAALGLGVATVGSLFVQLTGILGPLPAMAIATAAQLVLTVGYLLLAQRMRRTSRQA